MVQPCVKEASIKKQNEMNQLSFLIQLQEQQKVWGKSFDLCMLKSHPAASSPDAGAELLEGKRRFFNV